MAHIKSKLYQRRFSRRPRALSSHEARAKSPVVTSRGQYDYEHSGQGNNREHLSVDSNERASSEYFMRNKKNRGR